MASASFVVAAPPAKVVRTLQDVSLTLRWSWQSQPGVTARLHRPMNFLSFGDRIDVTVAAQGPASLVTLTSRPRFQLYNWGQDGENLRILQAALQGTSGTRPL